MLHWHSDMCHSDTVKHTVEIYFRRTVKKILFCFSDTNKIGGNAGSYRLYNVQSAYFRSFGKLV